MKGKYISIKKLEEMGFKVRKCTVCGGILPKHKAKYCRKECWKEARKEIVKKFNEKNCDKEKVYKAFKEPKEIELLKEIRDFLSDIYVELRKEG